VKGTMEEYPRHFLPSIYLQRSERAGKDEARKWRVLTLPVG
jgi:hypothetical protein